jgi:MoaA/NifB/PqqE/SkfB family radical SAM enzyme
MKNAEINLGYGCNSACYFCVSGDASGLEKRFASQKKINKELSSLYRKGFRSLGILGGEPTLHPHICEIAACAKKIGYRRIAITTNGILFSKKIFAERLARAGVNRFSVSIHTYRSKDEDVITGIPGSFRKKIEAIKNLTALRDRGLVPHGVAVSAVMYRGNYREMVQFAAYFKKKGVTDLRFNFIRAEGRARSKHKIIPSLRMVIPYAEKLIAWNERYGKMNISFGEVPWCFLHGIYKKEKKIFFKYIGDAKDADTDVSLLSRIDTKKFNWQRRRTQRMKQKFPACAQCIFDAACEGIYRNYCAIHTGPGAVTPFVRDDA